MKKKIHARIHKRLSRKELEIEIAKRFTGRVFEYVMSYFTHNSKKTCCHIPTLQLKVRKYGNNYTLEEA